ncbi:MAG: helicase C-terminal domain-containing protein, partial [Verrucomicrobiota bacterium]|nr:helicase C-terminal domain-containing protein [Verrucomicrobiota bacterium]
MIAPVDFHSDFVSEVSDFFATDGPLSRDEKFEYRPEQQQMAEAIARSLEIKGSLVVEAGTGVGKSLAYLVPSVLFALNHKRKAIITTHTINLQEQLLLKDIPLVQKLLPPFKAVLFKGRQNYLCQKRLAKAMEMADSLFESSEKTQLKQIAEWSARSKDGTLSDLPFVPEAKVWSQVCSEHGICTAKKCSADDCFYHKVRAQIASANVVVMNHHLFFLNLNKSDAEEGFLFGNDFVVFDEAHTVESVAGECLANNVSSGYFYYLLQRLFHPKTKKGLLAVLRDGTGIELATHCLENGARFFKEVEAKSNFSKGGDFRVRQAQIVTDTLSSPLLKLNSHLSKIMIELEDEDTIEELSYLNERVQETAGNIQLFLRQAEDDYVYWTSKESKSGESLSINAAPIDMSLILKDLLFRDGYSTIMTSATLAVNKSLDYFSSRVGADDADAHILGSPFDFQSQMKVYIPKNIPDPKAETEYVKSICHWIEHFIRMTHGKAFVLFTSYRILKSCTDTLRPLFDDMNIRLLVQGEGIQRHKLLQEFKQDTDSVLFGTDSFWTGVDVPGQALSNVIITRLPFAVPDSPVIEARLEYIEANGGNSFADFSVPEAVLKFRQGVGRLIRSKKDSGIVAILDSRIITKPYGKSFLNSLPPC